MKEGRHMSPASSPSDPKEPTELECCRSGPGPPPFRFSVSSSVGVAEVGTLEYPEAEAAAARP
eukprot:CAMPEP_0182522928 /NCGR_PEP_ID=MMETSP1323-20130603/665_1 /TAXON_ID=236787 /ORGANISM="Florenciella parvula, Strain RCC1693" /LENGTH=62 /DNA_ID=CAMNT_0024731173 /DNA_START=68 /DNA_END=252 /DNA_ORIENTATION=-